MGILLLPTRLWDGDGTVIKGSRMVEITFSLVSIGLRSKSNRDMAGQGTGGERLRDFALSREHHRLRQSVRITKTIAIPCRVHCQRNNPSKKHCAMYCTMYP